MNVPDVSVIILTYNQEETIARAIDSVLAQDTDGYRFEIVIGDDASADRTRSICEEYQCLYPDIIRLMPAAPNKGVVDNYFDTLNACRGRYIADCAGDDCWTDTERLKRQASLLDARPDVVMVHGAWREVSADGNTIAHRRPYGMVDSRYECDGNTLLEPLLSHRMPLTVHLSTAMFRLSAAKDAIAENRGMVINRAFGCEDLPLTAALLSRGRVVWEPNEVLAYTVGEPTVSNPKSAERSLRYYAATVLCTGVLARHYGVSSETLDRYFSSRAIFLAKLARHVGTADAISIARQAIESTGHQLPLPARLILTYARIRV